MQPAPLSADESTALKTNQLQAEAFVPIKASGALLLSYKSIQTLAIECRVHHAHLLHIQLDCSRLRVRYKGVNAVIERILEDEASLSNALSDLKNRILQVQHKRGSLLVSTDADLFSVRYSSNCSGYNFEFRRHINAKAMRVLDQFDFPTAQLLQLRQCLSQPTGLLVVTGNDQAALTELSIAMTLECTDIDNTITRISKDIAIPLSRVQQLSISSSTEIGHAIAQYNTVLVLDQLEHTAFNFQNLPVTKALIVQTMAAKGVGQALELLLSEGYSPASIAFHSIGFIACHSFRTLCEHCKRIDALDENTQKWMNQFRTPVSENVLAWLDEGGLHSYMTCDGCNHCQYTGFGGVSAAYNLVELTDSQKEALLQGDTLKLVRNLKSDISPVTTLLTKAKSGVVSLSEVRKSLLTYETTKHNE